MAENPTLIMPDFKYQWNFSTGYRHSTTKNVALNGRQQRFGNYPTSGYRLFTGDTQFLNQVQCQQLADFMNSVRGGLLAFYFFMPKPRNYPAQSLGSITGVSTMYVPYKDFAGLLDSNPATFTVTVAGVSKAFTVQSGVGPQGQDQITFTGGVQTGAVVGTFSGRAMITGVFEMDEWMERFYQNSSSISTSVSIKIAEVF